MLVIFSITALCSVSANHVTSVFIKTAYGNARPAIMKKVKRSCIAVNGTPSHSYRVSLVIWDHTVC